MVKQLLECFEDEINNDELKECLDYILEGVGLHTLSFKIVESKIYIKTPSFKLSSKYLYYIGYESECYTVLLPVDTNDYNIICIDTSKTWFEFEKFFDTI